MWFNYLKSDSPQRHRGTEKCFKQAWLNLPARKIFNLVIPYLTLSLPRTAIRGNPVALKILNFLPFVIPAKAGIHCTKIKMDSRFRGNDGTAIFSVPLCLCGEVFKSKVSRP